MEAYSVLKDMAIIIVAAKLMGLLAQKCRIPQVVGEILAGLLIGPSILGIVDKTDFLMQMAEIGVILLMFSAGLETNLKDLLSTGIKAVFIACAGVFIPLIMGTALFMIYYHTGGFNTPEFLKALSIGTIMTATSVSITVQALREIGRLKGEIGTTILSSAIIDDVIGIIVLTFVVSMKGGNTGTAVVTLKTLAFFACALIFGFVFYQIFKYIDIKHEHTRRVPILALAFCFGLSYIAEAFFGIADITGAYVAGVILCNIDDSEYVARKMDISSYMIFGPVFFASIGLKTDISALNGSILLFSFFFVIVALVSKIIGCGAMAKLLKFNIKDSLKIGVGMMTRGEVALIVSQKCLSVGLIDSVYFTSVILLILFSSILTPIILKIIYGNEPM